MFLLKKYRLGIEISCVMIVRAVDRYLRLSPFFPGTKTAAAMVVVQSPSLSPVADCVAFLVVMIIPLALNCCSFSRQALSGSNDIPMVVANIEAARSSA